MPVESQGIRPHDLGQEGVEPLSSAYGVPMVKEVDTIQYNGQLLYSTLKVTCGLAEGDRLLAFGASTESLPLCSRLSVDLPNNTHC